MPFQSKAQMRAAFGGYLGPEMKSKADEFAHATPDLSALPQHVGATRDAAKLKRAALVSKLTKGVK